jgi:hypothetical protein
VGGVPYGRYGILATLHPTTPTVPCVVNTAGTDSEVYLVPRAIFKDPFRPGFGNILVRLCAQSGCGSFRVARSDAQPVALAGDG